MITNAQLKDVVVANLIDIRITSIQLFINALINRKVTSNSSKPYRIKNKNTGNSYITTLDEFISSITADDISAEYYQNSDKMTGDRVHPFVLRLNNFAVELDKYTSSDQQYISTFGEGEKGIMFLVNYLSDGDADLPLKIFEVRLS